MRTPTKEGDNVNNKSTRDKGANKGDIQGTNKVGTKSAKYKIKTVPRPTGFDYDAKEKNNPAYRRKATEYFIPYIKNAVRRYCYVPEEFEDLVQDGILIVLESIDTFKPEKGVPFAAYVNSYLRWYYLKTYKYIRKNDLSLDQEGEEGKIIEVIDTGIDIEGDYFKKYDLKYLKSIMAELTEREREVINHYYFKGQKLKDVAQALGITERTATNLKYRAVTKLRQKFKEDK